MCRENWLDTTGSVWDDYGLVAKHYCEHCNDAMENTDGEFEVFCSFRCWYLDNIGAMKRELLTALKHGKAENWLKANSEYFSPSTFDRFERVIQNRINEKAAQVVTTLKAA